MDALLLALVAPVVGDLKEENANREGCKFRTMMAFLLGMEGGPKNTGMPRDVFRVVMDLLMPSWDPLRCKGTGTGLGLQG